MYVCRTGPWALSSLLILQGCFGLFVSSESNLTTTATSPTVTLTSNHGNTYTSASTLSLSATFSQSVSIPNSSSVTLSGLSSATLQSLTGSGSSFQLSILPGSSEGSLSVSLAAGAAANNNGSSSASNSVSINYLLPHRQVNLGPGDAAPSGNVYPDTVGLSMSSDGRYVAFADSASNLVSGDSNAFTDVFVRDRLLGSTERVSVSSAGVQGNGQSLNARISGDGRYVVFESMASNLVAGDTNATRDIFLHDRQTRATTRVSFTSTGLEPNADCTVPDLSSDGRYVSFHSSATNLVPGDTNASGDIFVRDTVGASTTRVSVSSAGVEGTTGSGSPRISTDGRYVVFWSNSTNLVAGDTNGNSDIFMRDLQTSSTTRVSLTDDDLQATGGSNTAPSITSDGRYVAWSSSATNLVTGDTNGSSDIFVRDLVANSTRRVSVHSSGTQAAGTTHTGEICASGEYVVYYSFATNLVDNDSNGQNDIFVHKLSSAETQRVSLRSNGAQSASGSYPAAISGDCRYILVNSALDPASSAVSPNNVWALINPFVTP